MNWLARIFVSAVVRRIAFVLVALVLSVAGIGAARSQPANQCSRSPAINPSTGCKDQGAAAAAAQAAAEARLKELAGRYPGSQLCGMEPTVQNDGLSVRFCQATGTFIGEYTRYFLQPCSQRQSLWVDGQIDITAGDIVCGGGCEYKMQPLDKKSLDTPGRESIITAKGQHVPTGKACISPPTPPKKPPPGKVCSETLGGHVFCTRDDGKICVTSATTGRTYCGPASDGLNATNPDRTENIKIGPPTPSPTPPTPPTPRPGEDWKPRDSANINNTSNNNHNSITINNNTGTPNTGDGSGNPDDGSGNPGEPGNGTGTGTGTGQGQGEQSGSAGSGVGNLYNEEPMTPTEALGAYTTIALDSPVFTAIRAFFGDCAYGGTCPTWSYDGGEMMGTLTFDQFCSGALGELLAYAGYVVLAAAALGAFKIAIY
ncbi:hypothetical protein [Lysobacter capsici]|uniref:hypothetical protein n=1 Tax=Lysobacter capsici TaxID=435897 RepID=UPI00287B9B7B|nr:hypothetical protein [Lysobacter capsici]WND83114.1 hypothetical protein RJ610_12495 [Lysobacter capsici]WND88313.1 hypothetical protein RJ609_12505 [Lysobacter capsici]